MINFIMNNLIFIIVIIHILGMVNAHPLYHQAIQTIENDNKNISPIIKIFFIIFWEIFSLIVLFQVTIPYLYKKLKK